MHPRVIPDFLATVVADRATAQLSHQLGFQSDMVARWVHGTRRPSTSSAFRLLRLLGQDPEALLRERLELSSEHPISEAVEHVLQRRTITQVASLSGLSRHAVHRCRTAGGTMAFESFVALLGAAHHDLLSWLLKRPGPIVPTDPIASARYALEQVPTGRALVLGMTLGIPANQLPELHRLMSDGQDRALNALPVQPGGRRRACVCVHTIRIDGGGVPVPTTPTVEPPPEAVDARMLSREFVRAVRGDRSQRAMAMRMGFRSNVVYRWETGRSAPYADELFSFLGRTGVDVLGHFRSMLPAATIEGSVAQAVASVTTIVSKMSTIPQLARHTGLNRHRLGKLRRASVRPRLPEFLGLFQAGTGRVIELLMPLAAPEHVPMLSTLLTRREARAQLSRSYPQLGRVLLALQHAGWLRCDGQRDTLAQMTGMEPASLDALVDGLLKSGLIYETSEGLRVGAHTGMVHDVERAAYERMVCTMLDWAIHEPAEARAFEVTFQQADITPALRALSSAVQTSRRFMPPWGTAHDASVAVVVHMTPLDGEPLWMKR